MPENPDVLPAKNKLVLALSMRTLMVRSIRVYSLLVAPILLLWCLFSPSDVFPADSVLYDFRHSWERITNFVDIGLTILLVVAGSMFGGPHSLGRIPLMAVFYLRMWCLAFMAGTWVSLTVCETILERQGVIAPTTRAPLDISLLLLSVLSISSVAFEVTSLVWLHRQGRASWSTDS